MLKRLFGKTKKQTKSAEIDENVKTISFLLLGPGNSGKSTILKQIAKIYDPDQMAKIEKDTAKLTANDLELLVFGYLKYLNDDGIVCKEIPDDLVKMMMNFYPTNHQVIQYIFEIDDKSQMRITDVCGQRFERKKWLRCYTDIHLIIYVMALSAYNETLFEDHTQNCYREALDVFEQTMKHEALAGIDVAVFLNKNDLFVSKIKQVPFSVFGIYFNKDLVDDANAIKAYLRNEYKKRFYNGIKPDKSRRRIQFHVTSAIDTNSIQTAMHLIQFVTVRKPMRGRMLM